jgi:hypothetical protein
MSSYFWDVIECMGTGELKERLNEAEKKGMISFEMNFCGLGMAEQKAGSIRMLKAPEMVPVIVLSAKFPKTEGRDGIGFSRNQGVRA